ncbi:uncharacterized protein (DUF1697 family) [Microbacterium proteolyticum]|uniref:Uncharacterized protein (DUF1697 family) n=1 Tax=Microbacterium proteolyticum TaxID=1572644 RepID=A0A7W5CHD4_9MICO|nr:DUF1697 domain-containing protein [Microbacterium proteolyticum]MBB3156934.1 uncharacterized protein (DUF1697 family) [Microbacterium proteolyticum]
MRHVAFVRNLNQGQRGHASTADLDAAFVDAGCQDVLPFQSNGTIVFSGEAVLAADAMSALTARTGVEREVFTLVWENLADIVDVHRHAEDAARRELTLHAPVRIALDGRSESEAARRRCRLLQTDVGWTVTANERDRESNATPVIERLTGTPATSRGLPTLARLVDRRP